MLNSKWFKREEFACKCGCGFSAVDAELLTVLEDVREHFKRPITISSGCRCPEHNKKVGGVESSEHTKAIAADIKILDIPPIMVYTYLNNKYFNTYGIGLYPSWVHIDVRPNKSRWSKK